MPPFPTPDAVLVVNNIEVVYDHVILVLKGVSLSVPQGGIVALLGANGAGKTTTLKAISNLLHAERGEVTKGSVVFEGERIDKLSPNQVVRRGCIQVLEGRHCFGHLTIDENLLTGAFTRRDGNAAIKADLEAIYDYFPRLKHRRRSMSGYTSGGEQQMCAIGRAMMSRPKMILLDEPSMGLAPQVVEEIFEIVQKLNVTQGVSFLLAEQNTNMALKYATYGYILETGRVVMDGAGGGLARERGREGILPRRRGRSAEELPQCQKLQAPQTLARLRPRLNPTNVCAMTEYFDSLDTQPSAERESLLFGRLPALLAAAMKSDAYAERFSGVDPSTITTRDALARLPILRKSDLPALQRAHRPFGGLSFQNPERFRRLFASPGPIFEAQGSSADPWGVARPMHAMGFRAGEIVLNTFSYHLVPAGFMMDSGARELGCAVIPAGPGNTEQQFELIEAFRPSLYCGTPDFLKILLKTAADTGRDVSSLKRALVSGAAFPKTLQGEIAEAGIEAFQAYATADIGIIAYETPTEGRYGHQREHHR